MIERIWKLATPVVSVIIGILAANKFNIFELMPFVPENFMYEVCITTYFTIAEIILEWLKGLIEDKVRKIFFSELEIVIHQPNTDANISTTPVLLFNNQDLSEACISIRIKGKKNHFKDSEVQIKNPAFVDIQSNYRRNEVRVDENNYYIDLEKLFGGYENGEFQQEFRIVMAQTPVDGESVAKIEPEVTHKKIRVIYRHNSAKIKAVRR